MLPYQGASASAFTPVWGAGPVERRAGPGAELPLEHRPSPSLKEPRLPPPVARRLVGSNAGSEYLGVLYPAPRCLDLQRLGDFKNLGSPLWRF